MHNSIFLGGVHRSGTSQLHDLLRDHPDLYGLQETGKPMDEGQHCQSVIPTDEVFGGPGRFAFSPDCSMTEKHPLATVDTGRMIWSDWHRYVNTPATRFVEKSPPNIVRTRFIQAIFPGSQQIVILRHPIIVAFATVKRWPTVWNGNWMPYAENAILAYERLLADRAAVKNLLIVRYEDLLMDESAIMNSIWQFLDLKPIYKQSFNRQRDAPYRAAWHESLTLLPDRGAGLLDYLDAVWGERFKRFGYHPSRPESLLPLNDALGS